MKNALLIVIAFALGGAAVWYFTGRQAAVGRRAAGGSARRARRVRRRRASGPAGGQAQAAARCRRRASSRIRCSTRSRLSARRRRTSPSRSTRRSPTRCGSVNFEDGDYVEAGHVLVELTNQEESALLAEARANLDDAENAAAPRQRISSARGLGARSPSSTPPTLAPRRQRSAAQHASSPGLRDRLIQAPFSGVLGFRQVSPGTLVSAEHDDHVDRRHLDRSSSTSRFPKRSWER